MCHLDLTTNEPQQNIPQLKIEMRDAVLRWPVQLCGSADYLLKEIYHYLSLEASNTPRGHVLMGRECCCIQNKNEHEFLESGLGRVFANGVSYELTLKAEWD